MKVEGQCHCGAIRFEAEVEPDDIRICNCLDCQMLSGTAFRANVPAPAAGFRITQGEPRRYIKTAESGAQRLHTFCGNCGSPVYSSALEQPKVFSLRVGTLAQRALLGRPHQQTWTRSRLPWVPPIDGTMEVEKQPG